MNIDETTIDNILIKLDQEESYDLRLTEQFTETFEDYQVYLEKEIFPILTPSEADLLLFIHNVIHESLNVKKASIRVFELHEFFDLEDTLWKAFEDNIKLPFQERITPVFEEIDEEDALAFVEDLLVEPDDDTETKISASGRDVIWNVSAAFIKLVTG